MSNARVAKPTYSSLDEEALRVVSAMPNWMPGKQDGQAVRVKYSVPVSFRLGNKETPNVKGTAMPNIKGTATPAESAEGMTGIDENGKILINGKEVKRLVFDGSDDKLGVAFMNILINNPEHFDYEIDKEIAAIISDGMVSGIIESLSDYSIVSSSHFSDTEKKITGIQTINGKPYKTVFYLFLNENKKDFCSVSYSIEIGYEDYFSGKIEEVVNNAVSVPINTFSTKDGTVTVLGYDYANCYSNDLFLVLCEYDNTSQLNVIPGIAYDVKAFDNNVELDHSFWMPDYPGFSNANKEVLPSGKYKYYEAFKLPESDSVIVEISELLSLSNNKLSLAFELK